MPETKKKRKYCHKCNKIYDKKLKQCKVCKKCHAITYCSEDCQVEDWPRHKDNCVPVMVTEVGEMGRGLVAAKDIKMGEQILIDSVVISLDWNWKSDSIMTRKVPRSLKEQIQALPGEKASQFHDLKSDVNIKFSERDLRTLRKENCFTEMKAFRSNRIESEKGDLLFFVLSRINHSCAPNVDECSLPKESKDQENVVEHELRAIKDISKGEEITIFYLNHVKSIGIKQLRREYLKEKFGFQCKCCVCCGQVDDQDHIIIKISEIHLWSVYAKKYETSSDEWENLAIKAGILMALSQQLHIGSVKIKIMDCKIAAYTAQMARDSVRLNKAMDVWKELVMTTGFEKFRLEYKKGEETIAEWAPQFNSKKPPSKEEIDSYYCE